MKKKISLISKTDKQLELVKGKPREKEEKFFAKFSETQLTGVLLITLSGTFLVQGMVRYMELSGRLEFFRYWFYIILMSIFFLIFSVLAIYLDAITSPLKIKRKLNLISFLCFFLGFCLFLLSLVFLIFII